MSSYNNIRKIKYTKNPSDAVALQEYIVFEDERAREKYVVFKFKNNLDQSLLAIKFEVLQYNGDNELIEKSVVLYDKFTAESNAPFVPNAKLKVNYACASINVNLTSAYFDRVKYINGNIYDNSYKFEHYAEDISARNEPVKIEKQDKKSKKIKEKKQKKQKEEKREFGVKQIFRKNIAKFPAVFNAFICVLVIAFVSATLVYFINNSPKFQLDGFDVEKISETEVNLLGYDGLETQITLPGKIGDYTVNKISGGYFSGGNLEKVVIDIKNGAVIDEGAFANCKSLKSVTSTASTGEITVMGKAFSGCTSLETVNLPTARLQAECFDGCSNLKNLTFSATIGDIKIADLFGSVAPSLDGYASNETCEVLSGKVSSVYTAGGELILPRGVKTFDTSAFSESLSKVTRLVIQTTQADGLKLDGAFFDVFTRLSELEIADGGLLSENVLGGLKSLEKLTVPALPLQLKSYLGDTQITSLHLMGSSSVSNAFLSGVTLKEVIVDETVGGISRIALSGTGVENLSIPYAGQSFTALQNLRTLELKPYSGYKALPNNYLPSGMPQLTEVTLAEGFNSLGTNLVSGLSGLQRLTLPKSITSYAYPVIGSGCTSLKTVNVSFTNNTPSSYMRFNSSYASTRNLCAEFINCSVPVRFFGSLALRNLSVSCEKIGSESKELFANMSLSYFQLTADEIKDTNLADMFSANGSVKVDKIVIDCPAIADGFFIGSDRITINDIILLNAPSVSQGLLDGITATNLLISDLIKCDDELITLLGRTRVDNFYFGGNNDKKDYGRFHFGVDLELYLFKF